MFLSYKVYRKQSLLWPWWLWIGWCFFTAIRCADDLIGQEHWDDVSGDEFEIDFETIDEYQTICHSSGNNDVLCISLILFMLCSSFYGISATALNHLIKIIHHILTCIKGEPGFPRGGFYNGKVDPRRGGLGAQPPRSWSIFTVFKVNFYG